MKRKRMLRRIHSGFVLVEKDGKPEIVSVPYPHWRRDRRMQSYRRF